MPDLERTGISLVVEGRNEYLASVQQARDATRGLGDAAASANTGLQGMSSGGLLGVITAGNVLSNVISAGAAKILQFSQNAINATSSLQDVRVNLETLTAAELKNTGAASTMAEAMEMAVPVADMIMGKLKELSLASPFEYKQILSVYQLNKAFGQSTEMSLELTKAITNLGAANTSIPGSMERIAYNFSQMAMTGRITKMDINQLSQAGLNLSEMFRNELGMSVEEVNQKLQSGEMTFAEVSKAFASYVDKNFGQAAERAAKTFSGLKSSFNDLSFFSSVDIFGGALGVVTENLSGLFDKTQDFIQGGGLLPIGAGLQLLTEELFNLGGQAATAGQNFFDQFGGKIQETANNALSWGINVTTQLATGLIQGASDAIVAAMNFIGEMLSFFLSPGSPPKVAPDIDKWGASAMGEFLRGFGDADFTILEGSQSALKSALSAMVGAGDIDKGDQQSIFKSLSSQIATAVAGGSELSPVLDSIKKQLGEYGADVSILVEKQFAYGKALEKVKAAEDALIKAREKEEAANVAVGKAMDEYNELARAGASPEVLAATRKEFMLAKQQREEAAKAGDQAERDLETGKKQADALKEQLNLQNRVLDQLTELTKSDMGEKIGAGVAAGIKKGLGGAGGLGKGMGAGLGEGLAKNFETATKNVQGTLEKMKEDLRKKLGDLFKPLTDAWNKSMQPALQTIGETWNKWAPTFGQAWDQFVKPVLEYVLAHGTDILLFFVGFEGALKAMGAVSSITGVVKAMGGLSGMMTALSGVIVPALPFLALAGAVGLLLVVIKNYGPQAWKSLQMLGQIIGVVFRRAVGEVGKFFTNLKSQWSSNWAMFKTIVSTLWTNLQDNWNGFWNGLGEGIAGAWEGIKLAISTAFDSVILTITSRMDQIDSNWREDWEQVKQAAAEKWNEIVSSVTGKLAEIGSNITTKAEEFKATLANSWNTAWSNAQELWENIRSAIATKIGEVKTEISTKVEEIKADWKAALQNLLDAITPYWDSIKSSFNTLVERGKEALRESISSFQTLGKNIIDGLLKGIDDAKQAVISTLANLALQALDAAKKALGISSPSSVFAETVGVPIVMGIVEGILSKVGDVGKAIASLFTGGAQAGGGAMDAGGAQQMADTFTGSLMPAMQGVGNYLSTVLMPMFTGAGLYWTEVFNPLLLAMTNGYMLFLLPAMQMLYNFMISALHPEFAAFGSYLIDVFHPETTALTEAWQVGLLTALTSNWSMLSTQLNPAVKMLWTLMSKNVIPITEKIITFTFPRFMGSLSNVESQVRSLINAIKRLLYYLDQLSIPAALEQHSPSPFERSLMDVNSQFDTLNKQSVKDFNANLGKLGNRASSINVDSLAAKLSLTTGGSSTVTESRTYNATFNTRMEPSTVRQGFEYFRVMGA